MALPGITKVREQRKEMARLRVEAEAALVNWMHYAVESNMIAPLSPHEIDRVFNAAGMLRAIVAEIARLDEEIAFMEET
jgi:hypothetical protein